MSRQDALFVAMRDIIRLGMSTKGNTSQPRNIWLFYSPWGSLAQPNQPNPTRGIWRGRGITTGIGRGNGRGQMPNGKGNVGNWITEMPNKPSSSQPLPSSLQPLSYTGATSSSSQPPKSPTKRFKSPANKLRPWMF
ncbi:unnamed protein product [Prunus armeniaca]|uniref:Uncharacterized protein n=1 Tax=Prunus armeniaca TaxID=36596 RepID=A0A6J5V7G5_PRUAR|nr:unnamed protein product [Prunus armeniaca]